MAIKEKPVKRFLQVGQRVVFQGTLKDKRDINNKVLCSSKCSDFDFLSKTHKTP